MTERPFPDPSILLHPNIPKPLHLMAPRTLLGQSWWDDVRRTAYWKYMYYCHSCGVDGNHAPYSDTLEAHEMYDIDYTIGKMEYVETVALCYSCHNYIHSGRMQMLLKKGELTLVKFNAIRKHGDALLKEAGIVDDWTEKLADLRTRGKICVWSDWHLVIDGVRYERRFERREDWMEYWGVKPDDTVPTILI